MVPDGEAANTPGFSDGADFYTPEQNVLAFGMFKLTKAGGGEGVTRDGEGATKTMRKLKSGDRLQFISFCDQAAAVEIHGIIQFFCKS